MSGAFAFSIRLIGNGTLMLDVLSVILILKKYVTLP